MYKQCLVVNHDLGRTELTGIAAWLAFFVNLIVWRGSGASTMVADFLLFVITGRGRMMEKVLLEALHADG